VEKVAQKSSILMIVIFQKLPIENKYPIGENSPNLVTLTKCTYLFTEDKNTVGTQTL
jgi:hypothetical protein